MSELLSLCTCSAGRSKLKNILQLKFFLVKQDKPYFQENIKEGSLSLFVTFKIMFLRYLRRNK